LSRRIGLDDIGIEGTYIGTGLLGGRDADATRPVTVNGLPAYTEKHYDTTQIRIRQIRLAPAMIW
jgi:hypothetical protein